MIRTKRGLKIPISGEPSDTVDQGNSISSVAVVGPDFIGMKPTLFVKEGDTVQTGQKLFEDKKTPGVVYTAPASGKVVRIARGERRAFQAVEIRISGAEHVEFEHHRRKPLEALSSKEIRDLLIESGMWACIRQRPFDKTPSLDSEPHSIFVSALDTQPLAMDPKILISNRYQEFKDGLTLLSKLPKHNIYLSTDKNGIDFPELPNLKSTRIAGIHPAGNVGTQIHFLQPVSPEKVVWHVGYQDVVAIGHLFRTGRLDTERWVALAGPRAQSPRIIKTRLGANLQDLVKGELKDPESTRVISGSVLNGRKMDKDFGFLGRFHTQVSCIEEDSSRVLLGWHSPGFNKFSQKRIYVSKLAFGRKFDLGSSTHGSPRALVPTGSFEEITPLDILPTQMLRALLSKDTDTAQALGCLDLAEEDMATYTFVSPGKIDFGSVLRDNLDQIEREG